VVAAVLVVGDGEPAEVRLGAGSPDVQLAQLITRPTPITRNRTAAEDGRFT
jgi:hypothetical protein